VKLGGNCLAQSEYLYRTFAEGDEEGLKRLVEPRCASILASDYWEWKYSHNPNFDPSLVAVAEKNGEIVACNHWLLRDVKLSSSSVAKAVLCCDIAVHPDHRGRGVARSLLVFSRSSSLSSARGAVLSYAFADAELSKRLYQPAAGYIPMVGSTVRYGRRWSWRDVVRRVEEMNMNVGPEGAFTRRGVKRGFKVVFHILGARPLSIAVNEVGIEASEQDVEGSTVTVKGDLGTLAALKRRQSRIRTFLKALLTRRLKLSGSLFGIISLYRHLALLEEIFHFA